MKALTLLARRWFDRKNGNTYHVVEILIDGVSVHHSPMTYGYDRAYETTAAEWLEANGYLPAGSKRQALWRVCQDAGVKLDSRAVDVPRKGDLAP